MTIHFVFGQVQAVCCIWASEEASNDGHSKNQARVFDNGWEGWEVKEKFQYMLVVQIVVWAVQFLSESSVFFGFVKEKKPNPI